MPVLPLRSPPKWQRGGRTVLLTGADGQHWLLARARIRDRLLAHWRALDLDAQLAAGVPAATDRLRAVRAGMLVAPAHRRMLAGGWERLLSGDAGPWSVPEQRSRVVAAQSEIRELIHELRVPQPVSARGVAIAELLLTDGAGPLFHRTSPVDLGAAVRDAIHHLDPYTAPLAGL